MAATVLEIVCTRWLPQSLRLSAQDGCHSPWDCLHKMAATVLETICTRWLPQSLRLHKIAAKSLRLSAQDDCHSPWDCMHKMAAKFLETVCARWLPQSLRLSALDGCHCLHKCSLLNIKPCTLWRKDQMFSWHSVNCVWIVLPCGMRGDRSQETNCFPQTQDDWLSIESFRWDDYNQIEILCATGMCTFCAGRTSVLNIPHLTPVTQISQGTELNWTEPPVRKICIQTVKLNKRRQRVSLCI